jgi:ubiquinone/menaquinone biosynthesis C-methylase UbiE
MKTLDIGCGSSKVSGAIGIDFNADLSADVVHDLNQYPYPFKNNEFDIIYIKETLILLNNPVDVMEEVYRVSKKGAKIIIVQPYFRSVWGHVDPWIKTFATVHSFAFFDPDDPICQRYQSSKARFSTDKILFNEGLDVRWPLKKIILRYANKFPRRYELYLSHLFPLDRITYHLTRL